MPKQTSQAGAPGGYAAGLTDPMPAEAEIGLRELLTILRRRLWILIATIVPLVALAAFVISRLTPEFTAESLILIEENTGKTMSVDSVIAGLSGDMETVQSEAFVLRSPTLASRVIDRLNLAADPEYNPFLRDPQKQRPTNPIDSEAIETSAVIAEFQDRLDIAPQSGTRVISVQFRSAKPQLAADIANLIAEEYLSSRIEAKYESTKRASSWLSERIDELRNTVDLTERKIEELRQDYGLLQGNGATLSSQELVELNTQLVLARSARAEAEARLRQVRSLTGSQGGAATASEVLGSALIQRLREQQAEVEGRVAELSSELGEMHPRMVQLRAESEDLRDRIANEVGKIVTGLENSLDLARARERALGQRVEEIKQRVGESNRKDIEVRALEREAQANRQLLATMLSRQKETITQEDVDFQQADARVISRAEIPLEPSFPKPAILLVLVFVGATILGLLGVIVVELLDSGFRSGDEIEAQTGVASLGFLPRARGKNRSVFEEFRTRPSSAFGEAIRTLGWTLSLVSAGKDPKVILVTSSTVSEGKSITACCLAAALSQADKRVLLIDADLRRPSVHTVMEEAREPGLVDILANEVELERVVQQGEDGGPWIVPAGPASPNPANLLGSSGLKRLVSEAAATYDVVIIDSPPVMAGADARILAGLADATIFVVRWAKTRRETVKHCLRQLDTAGANISGVLLTMVDSRKHSQYTYGDSGAYAGALEKYYAG